MWIHIKNLRTALLSREREEEETTENKKKKNKRVHCDKK